MSGSTRASVFARLRRTPPSRWLALGVLALVVLAAATASLIAPHPPLRQVIGQRLQPPGTRSAARAADGAVGTAAGAAGAVHAFGTDQLGRDILSRILHGGRISLLVALAAVLLSGTMGTLFGLMAGYAGGVADRVVMRVAEVQLAFPFILLVVSIVAVLGPGTGNVVLALGISGWVAYAKLVRAQVLTLRELAFVEAARAVGAGAGRIMFRQILPNTLSPVVVLASFSVAQMIILESALSFLGLGVQPPMPTWGGMLADSRGYLAIAWWFATFPGAVLMATVLAINVLGDWLRDLLDPTMRI